MVARGSQSGLWGSVGGGHHACSVVNHQAGKIAENRGFKPAVGAVGRFGACFKEWSVVSGQWARHATYPLGAGDSCRTERRRMSLTELVLGGPRENGEAPSEPRVPRCPRPRWCLSAQNHGARRVPTPDSPATSGAQTLATAQKPGSGCHPGAVSAQISPPPADPDLTIFPVTTAPQSPDSERTASESPNLAQNSGICRCRTFFE